MTKRISSYFIVAVISALLGSTFQPFTYLDALAWQTECRTFEVTGKTVCGKFLVQWQKNGGLPQYGYPISKEFVELSDLNGKPYTVQYFERAVFELHPDNQPPYDVLLAQLGTFQFKRKYPGGEPEGPVPTPTAITGVLPQSARAEMGRAYPITLHTHCGIDWAVDFDGSFWDALEPEHRKFGNPPPGVGNPGQAGMMTLIDENHARFQFDSRIFYFHRHIGPKVIPPCY